MPRFIRHSNAIRLLVALAFSSVSAIIPNDCFSQQTLDESLVRIDSREPWIRNVSWERGTGDSSNDESTGTRYLLIDQQVDTTRGIYFGHTVRRLENESAVQENGSISVRFDPSYQELVLHTVNIHRGDQVIKQLTSDRVRLSQPESELPSGIYNGEHRAIVILEDLRVGDMIEVSHSLIGVNPVLGDEFADTFSIAFSLPVQAQSLRFISSKDRELIFRNHGHSIQPLRTEADDQVELNWNIPAQEAVQFEDYVPYDTYAAPFIELSTFEDWQSVANWASNLYPRHQLNDDVVEIALRWKEEFIPEEDRAKAAIRFVQDEVRYFGIEVGPDSFRPAPPAMTLQRLYGDCKGKALLLCELLSAMGIESHPALVRSPGRSLSDRLPSPFLFNHAIARIRIRGQEYWVDATRTQQRGPLAKLPVSRFRDALVIDETTKELVEVRVPKHDEATKKVTQRFDISSYEQPVTMTVETVFLGVDAENSRDHFASKTKDSISKDYLNYYAETYPGIRDPSLTFSDDAERNRVRITERYMIDDFWEQYDDGDLYAYCFPDTINDVLTEPTTRIRSQPLRINHPVHVVHTNIIKVPEDYGTWDSRETVEHEAFRFSWSAKYQGKRIVHRYELETLADTVTVSQVEDYLSKLEEVDNLLGDYVEPPRPFGLATTNWLLVIASLMYAALIGGFAIWFLRRPSATTSDLPPAEKIHGWLVLVGIGVCLSPFAMSLLFTTNLESYYHIDIWRDITSLGTPDFEPLFPLVLAFELFTEISWIIASFALLFLFLKKRSGFPKLYITLSIGGFLLAICWLCFAIKYSEVLDLDAEEAVSDATRAFVACLIWVPYMLVSERVKRTFVR